MGYLNKSYIQFLFACLFYLSVCPSSSSAQNNGLHFNGQESVQDKRTSLDLSPDNELCFDSGFELSFDLSFTPEYRDYYGYIFRIIDENGRNTDLIYDQKSINNQNFKLVTGDKFSSIAFNLNKTTLFNKWTNFRIKYDRLNDKLLFYTGQKVFIEKNAGLKSSSCFKFLFGANHYKKFKTTDVPTMNIKDIKILENGNVKYYWPLDEIRGGQAAEHIHGKDALAENPLWINAMHSNWKMVKSFSIRGKPSTAFNPEKETIYITGPQAVYSYTIPHNNLDSIQYQITRDLSAGNQSVFDLLSGNLYNFFIDQRNASYFDFSAKRWNKPYERPTKLTRYWQANKFISKADSSLYIIGGYGQLSYQNTVQRYHLKHQKWETVAVKGDIFRPRYLAALGASADGQTAYIIGGYGSASGQQMLNPENYYDLVQYQVKNQTFKKIYRLKNPENDFAFASSLVIDPVAKQFYGLVFPNNKYNSHLQLIRGSLTSPKYELVGNYIPYLFYDIRSYADLYWCPQSKKLVAVTLFTRENNQTEVKLYTIEFPPATLIPKLKKGFSVIYVVLGVMIGLILVIFGYKKIRIRKSIHPQVKNIEDAAELVQFEPSEPTTAFPETKVFNMSIYLFGNMQIFDREGHEITKMLSPLLKELLLLILLYSMRKEGGISPKKLDEILWFGKSEKIARNNRSVNIAKLKAVLEKKGGCGLSKDNGYWKIEVDHSQVNIDYYRYLQIVKDKGQPDEQKIAVLLALIQRGTLLLNIEYDWLDDFKSEISNEITDFFLRFTRSAGASVDSELIIRIANHIFYFDPVNEEAMILKCKALAHLGKHAMAKNTFEKFMKDFNAIYGVGFEQSFQSIIES